MAVFWNSDGTYSVVDREKSIQKGILRVAVNCAVKRRCAARFGNTWFNGEILGTFKTKQEAQKFLDSGEINI